jgi:hypothetical protein
MKSKPQLVPPNEWRIVILDDDTPWLTNGHFGINPNDVPDLVCQRAVVADLTVIVGEAIALTAAGLVVPAKVWTALHRANMKVRDMIE